MTNGLTRPQALVLGVVVVLALLLGGTALFAVGSRQWVWNESYVLETGFQQVRGVEPGTRVRVQGIDAGEISAIRLPTTPGGEVCVSLRLERRFRSLVRSDAVARIADEGLVGSKVLEIDPGSETAGPAEPGARIGSVASSGLTETAQKIAADAGDTLAEVRAAVKSVARGIEDVRNGEGTFGKELVASLRETNHAIRELRNGEGAISGEVLQSLRQFRRTMASVKQSTDAVQNLPLVGGLVKDPVRLLVRPDCDRQRRVFLDTDLFDPDQASLTAQGRQALDALVPWLKDDRVKACDLVVVSYRGAGLTPEHALELTRKQSEAVTGYLIGRHAVNRYGWFGRRDVTPLGGGAEPPPVADKEPLPAARVEVVLFVPRG